MIIDRYYVLSMAYNALWTLFSWGICVIKATMSVHTVHTKINKHPHIV